MQAHKNGLPAAVITAYLRVCLWRASQLHISDDQLARFAELAECRVEAERTTLNRFANGQTERFGRDSDSDQLYKFFTATQLGRAIASFEPPRGNYHTSRDSIVDSGVQKHDELVERRRSLAADALAALADPATKLARVIGTFPTLQADLASERLAVTSLFGGILSRAVAAVDENLIGNYYCYHPGLAPGSGRLQYSVRAVRIGRGPGGLLWFEDYLSERRPGGGIEVFHNIGIVFYFSDRPQFISIDVGGRRNIRFFMPSQTNVVGSDVEQMTGPMTSWTRTRVPANRYQRLVRVTDQDFDTMKRETCKKPLSELPPRHADECRTLREIESVAAADLSMSTDTNETTNDIVTTELQGGARSRARSQGRLNSNERHLDQDRPPPTGRKAAASKALKPPARSDRTAKAAPKTRRRQAGEADQPAQPTKKQAVKLKKSGQSKRAADSHQ